ncbi:MAG: hypothetical protein KGJ89_05480 [Patescibacteria group bacterium]|nr:hypothetical protein [Patescibacteria group bacterium]MDE2227373.1 hypothetical protein [Patescibacteria group bacterium]
MAKLRIISNYGVAPIEVLNSTALTWRAKGMFTYLQSKPDNWRFSIERIKKDSPSGKQEVRSALHELEEAGFLVRVATKAPETGKWTGYDYELRESPSSTWPTTGRPTTGRRSTARPNTLSKIEGSKIENSKIDIRYTLKGSEPASEPVAGQEVKEIKPDLNNDFFPLFEPLNPTYERLFANRTERAALERLIKKFGPQGVKSMLERLPQIVSMPYAPKVTKPSELERDMGKIRQFLEQEKSRAATKKIGLII